MTIYRATAERDESWWTVDVEDVGWTQGHTIAEARFMAKDLVVTMLDLEDDSEVEIDLRVKLP